jgi:hypothetical protein
MLSVAYLPSQKPSSYLFNSNVTSCLLFLLAFILCNYACGTNETQNFDHKINITGSYQPTLIFPADIPREESLTNDLIGIDCKVAQISTIEFTFFINGLLNGPYVYACQDHEAYIKGIPVGTGIQVEVYAYNSNHAEVLYGSETTDI